MGLAYQILNLLFLVSIGVILVFAVCVWTDFKLKRSRQEEREKAEKITTQEPGTDDPRH